MDLRQDDNVLIPFPESRPDEDAQYIVFYDKPEEINIIQSFACDTDRGVEIALTMPSVRIHTTLPVTFY